MIIIAGRNGFLGAKIFQYLSRKHLHNQIIGTSRYDIDKNTIYLNLDDIGNFDYSILSEKDIIIYTIAESSPDICDKEYDLAYKINVTNTIRFINNCIKKSVRVIFFSSDTVYGEKHSIFFEDEPLNPLGKYATMKAEVEKYFYNSPMVKILHLSYIFSREDKFTKYLFNCEAKQKNAEIFLPFDRSVLYIEDLIQAVENLIIQWDYFGQRCINLAGPDLISKKDIADEFAKYSSKENFKYKIIEPPKSFFNVRPRIINMQSKYLKTLLGYTPTNIKQAMKKEMKGFK